MTAQSKRIRQGLLLIALVLCMFLFSSLATFAQDALPRRL